MFNRRDFNILLFLLVCCLFTIISIQSYAALVHVSVTRVHTQVYNIAGRVKLRDSAVLTNSFAATNYTQVSDYNNIGLFLDITQGSLTSFEYIVQWSPDGTNWFYEVTETVVAGVVTDTVLYYTRVLAGDDTDQWSKPLPIRAEYIRLAVKGTGTVTNSDCEVFIIGRY